jgi:hypothetical protein
MTRLLRLATSNSGRGLWAFMQPWIGASRTSDNEAADRDQIARDHHDRAKIDLDRLEL